MGKRFGDLVRDARMARSMSQETLAAAAKLTVRTLIRIEGGANPAPETVMALCSVLGIPNASAHVHLVADRNGRDRADMVMPPAFGPASEEARSILVETARRTVDGAKVVFASDLFAEFKTLLPVDETGPQWSELLGEIGPIAPGTSPSRNEDHIFRTMFVSAQELPSFSLFERQVHPPYLMPDASPMLVSLLLSWVMAVVATGRIWFSAPFHWPLLPFTFVAFAIEGYRRHLVKAQEGARATCMARDEVVRRLLHFRDVNARVHVMTDNGIVTLQKDPIGIHVVEELDARVLVDVIRTPGATEGVSTWKLLKVDTRMAIYENVPDAPAIDKAMAKLLAVGKVFDEGLATAS